ncbi:NADH dehydrogenase [ubiquinone] 1 alpha subcomplex subunit 13 [Athalia rosae]|uniref:NADH dehydrogenase [ubiquinone] 1 alpha subcomplex subunit 13 n=1 Tax=Athalia rosae TaxID=37344 RepID=UPI0020334E03|nr:NADH dehydrogenase [ubiquinone] 1 alpha subcomplex subunit 13 [Athalia rosae]
MATAAKTTPQDLPPAGGYGPLHTERVKLRTILSGRNAILGYFAVTTGALLVYAQTYKAFRKHEVEMRSARLAIYPMLLAERDREFLKQLKRNREAEGELMKNVPNWEVGTWYGSPVFKTTPADKLTEPALFEYYAFASRRDYINRLDFEMWT